MIDKKMLGNFPNATFPTPSSPAQVPQQHFPNSLLPQQQLPQHQLPQQQFPHAVKMKIFQTSKYFLSLAFGNYDWANQNVENSQLFDF